MLRSSTHFCKSKDSLGYKVGRSRLCKMAESASRDFYIAKNVKRKSAVSFYWICNCFVHTLHNKEFY